MAPGEAWLTPHHHSLGASPICSPGAASRRVLHTSSHSKGCHLEDRKRCALSPLGCRRQHLLPWGYRAKDLGERRGVSSDAECPAWSSSGASLPHVAAGLRLQTVLPCGRSVVQRCTTVSFLPVLFLFPRSVYTQHVYCANDMDLFPNWKSVFMLRNSYFIYQC